ncbi:hypothetical protein D6C91_09481 [Aureobasidium pullulans]|uniref:VHS domain-containing protein n=1 Tax=Aureobasidium pullulans TaxID=5580 RepID=A0A4S9SIU7_AURPU|nr:hypothetical protein D6C91_09481 [Aureobasidium pullulans]
MEFFSWCMAYPCPYGPCNPAEVDEWKKECEAIHEKRRQKKELKMAAKRRVLGPPTRPPPRYSVLPCRLSRYSISCPACRLRDLKSILRQWVVQQRKPYSAVSVQIDRLTSEQYEEDDLSGIIDLVEVIRIQSSGPTEAARAIRKKLKYGNPHSQIRALNILDGLIQNAGSRFQKTFADEPLLERLRLMVRDDVVDLEVRNKCNILFRQWAVAYKDTPGLHNIANLYKQLPQKPRPRQAQAKAKVLRETEADVHEDPSPTPPPQPSRGHSRSSSAVNASASVSRPVTLTTTPHYSIRDAVRASTKKKDKTTATKFNFEKEKPNMIQSIAQASIASTNLLNGLQLINRENERVSENPEVMNRFETCKLLRRNILRYIQLVEHDDWIGSLLSANDELVKALTSYEIMDRSLDDDSDSDAWEHMPEEGGSSHATGAESQLAGLKLGGEEAAPPKPPRPGQLAMPARPDYGKARAQEDSESENEYEEDDEDNPFGDSNAVKTPHIERPGMTWKNV